jgi:hypothetical protein
MLSCAPRAVSRRTVSCVVILLAMCLWTLDAWACSGPLRAVQGCPSPATRPVCALRRGPVACRRPTGLASRWRAGAAGGASGALGAPEGGSRAKWLCIFYTLIALPT